MIHSDLECGINLAAVRAAVDSGLMWLQTDPLRGMRNLLDLGSYFAHTRCQREFFQTARRLLNSRRSQYMRLVERILVSVDTDVLKTVGIDLGYFSWSLGVQALRELRVASGIYAPWSIVFELDGAQPGALSVQEIRAVLAQAHRLGTHSFWFNARGDADYMAGLIRLFGAFKDCAFMLIMEGAQLTHELAQLARAQRNTLIALDRASARDGRATAMLREARLLFGLSETYDDSNAKCILSGSLVDAVERHGGHFALLKRGAQCSEHCCQTVHNYAISERFAPSRPAFTIDLFADMAQIDHIISRRACFVVIGPDGTVYDVPWIQGGRMNLRCAALRDVLWSLMSDAPR